MKDTQNFAILMLLVTALILGGMLAFSNVNSTAYASGTTVEQEGVIMGCGAVTGTTDFLYVIDTSSRKLIAYYADGQKKALTIAAGVDLKEFFRKYDAKTK